MEKEGATRSIEDRIIELEIEHRDLDDMVNRLTEHPFIDQLQMRRFKKRKLLLKDMIAKLRSQLIPDMDA